MDPIICLGRRAPASPFLIDSVGLAAASQSMLAANESV